MTEKLLGNWSEADGIPRSIALTVVNYAALLAATAFPGKTAFNADDLEKLVLLSDCKQVWRMTGFSPPAWDLDDEGPLDYVADFASIGALSSLTNLPASTFDVGSGSLAVGKRVLAAIAGTYVGIFVLAANGSNWDLSRAPDLASDGQVSDAEVIVRYTYRCCREVHRPCRAQRPEQPNIFQRGQVTSGCSWVCNKRCRDSIGAVRIMSALYRVAKKKARCRILAFLPCG